MDAFDSDRRLMSGLLVKFGYEPIAVEGMEAAKEEVAKLPPGAFIVADHKLPDGSAKELVNWLKSRKHYIPVIAIVNNRTCPEATDVMEDHGAVAVIQRPAIDKELVDYVSRYVRDISSMPNAKSKPIFTGNYHPPFKYQLSQISPIDNRCQSGISVDNQYSNHIYSKSSSIIQPPHYRLSTSNFNRLYPCYSDKTFSSTRLDRVKCGDLSLIGMPLSLGRKIIPSRHHT